MKSSLEIVLPGGVRVFRVCRAGSIGELFTGNVTALRHCAKRSGDRIARNNQQPKKASCINQLKNCLKFNQNVGRPASAMIPVPALQLFNKVIHRFRGYMELRWQLNQLTVR
jgi:hypothetical protein